MLLAALKLLASALVSTLALEMPLALLFLLRVDRTSLAVVALAQVATNPIAETICILSGWHYTLPLTHPSWIYVLVTEAAVVVVEGLLYRFANITRHPWAMSITLNVVSFGLGILLDLWLFA